MSERLPMNDLSIGAWLRRLIVRRASASARKDFSLITLGSVTRRPPQRQRHAQAAPSPKELVG